ncbi:VOC family protein [Georgenia sp. SYP-B2076]|uniref:VOC family protein n=1 Tax=Georgenia sp. SYP-B2076 TaxID=2495881 RepID=UPI000F8DE5CD|nr:VOC family protein [Georgenia sp. SYP-B2076]
MAVRWYSVVVDCKDVRAQAGWWAEAIGWRPAYEADDEVVLVPPHALTDRARKLAVEERGPELTFVPVPEGKSVKNRLHMDLAPRAHDDQAAEVQRLLDLGAVRVDVGQGPEVTWVVLADPEGNEFCVLSPRD